MVADDSTADHDTLSDDTMSWLELARQTAERLAGGGVANATSEARWMVEQASGMDDGALAVEGELPATVGGVRRVDAMVARRCAGEPLQYVLGQWSFRSLDLMVDSRGLIPRPETEQVVQVVLDELESMATGQSGPAYQPTVVDLGTGSGAIALSIAVEHPTAVVIATDVSDDALGLAAANLAGVGMAGSRVRLASGSWFTALSASFAELAGAIDIIVSNPPYVASGEVLPPEVADHEPVGALVAGPEGTEAVREVVLGARDWLRPGGAVIVELAPHQADVVAGLAADAGYHDVEVRCDLTGRQRMVMARWPGRDDPVDR